LSQGKRKGLTISSARAQKGIAKGARVIDVAQTKKTFLTILAEAYFGAMSAAYYSYELILRRNLSTSPSVS